MKQNHESEEKTGDRELGRTGPPTRVQFAHRGTRANVRPSAGRAIEKSLSALHFVRSYRAALCAARVSVPAGVGVTVAGKWGVSDPRSSAPFFAPRPVQQGSLTPHLRVSFVRLHSASTWSCTERSAAWFRLHVLISSAVRFWRERAFCS